ncbi:MULTISPECIES: BamA/TamA family outer membrane protein [unclassified Fibrobacter]|uniref:BamA/TamA family outer membrane protein n=1 Tax=unclassified Fibrobacter TaxID=2634177 RepID=UPI001304860C|nr:MULTISPECIES: BamA/TamA family outer membrane protein [unclassified Fibrobacter]
MAILLLLLAAVQAYASETSDASPSGDSVEVKTSEPFYLWAFNHIIQPALNGLIYPISAPIHYTVKNGVLEKGVDLITYGEKKNIMVYPSFNLKPGSTTLIGANYRHRGILLDQDYLVTQFAYYANGDISLAMRYTKHSLFGSKFFGGYRLNMLKDRDASFILPETKERFTQPDSSVWMTFRLGRPISESMNWNIEFWGTVRFNDASLPDGQDSILISDKYPIQDRGLYQKGMQFPLGISLFYDNLDYPYAPSKGFRIGLIGSYNFVPEYDGIDYEDLGLKPPKGEGKTLKDGGMNHDFIKTEFLYQHYFYLGSTGKQYILSAKEARTTRRFYTDFSWDEAMRIWRPENVRNTLLERRVIAIQYRLLNIWEMEEGGAPYNAFPTLNARTPLRGYGNAWSSHHMMSLSCEYRWPVDRFVDGVIFNEYAMVSPTITDWSFDKFYNSWGFGIRVRQPNMYLFRLQFGFHGLHGLNLVMTIAPEFK